MKNHTSIEMQSELQKAKDWGNLTLTKNPVAFTSQLSGPDGAFFTLFRESHHSTKDIESAKAYLRRSDDVTGFKVETV